MKQAYDVLDTKRLILQTLHWDLFEELARLLANPIVHRYFPGPLSAPEARAFLSRVLERQERDGYSFWAVFRKDDSVFIGICGLLKQTVADADYIEVAYRFDNAFWGHGYAPEAAAGCIDYARDVLHATSVISLIRPENKQSIRVAEKNGFIIDQETMFGGYRHRIYRKDL